METQKVKSNPVQKAIHILGKTAKNQGTYHPLQICQGQGNGAKPSICRNFVTLTRAFDSREKLRKKAEKALTASLFACILKQYHKNGIERPKGILRKRSNSKVCAN